jgi:Uma2 family endonuclease
MSTQTPTLTPPGVVTAPAAGTPAGHGAPAIIINGSIRIPPLTDLDSFRAWAREERPENGRYSYIAGTIWIDLTREQGYTHNQVKAEVTSVLHPLARSSGLGIFFPDGMLLGNEAAGLSTVPDGVFVRYDTIRTGRVRQVPNKKQVVVVELEGTPDMVLAVVSDSSVEKDTVTLPPVYARAGIPEFWRSDARGELKFEIFRLSDAGYEPTQLPDGWWRSPLFDREFLLVRHDDPLSQPAFALEVRPCTPSTP